ncbi:MAG: ExbD/TolR family protein [bacterium]
MYFNFDREDSDRFVVVKPRRNKSISSFALRLTSMIDMFTILLVFLLQSFSAEGEIMSVAKDLRLPESTAKTPPKASPILVVTNEWIILDGNPVEKVAAVMSQEQNLIQPLRQRLAHIRTFSTNLATLDRSMGFRGQIAIQGDREIPFALLKKIMFTCGQEGFNNMLLAVNQAGES